MDCDEIFIDTVNDTTFKRGIFNAIVAPRPIGWISTVDVDGVPNLAPYSYFNLVSTLPGILMFSGNTPEDRALKDTVANVRATGEFVFNLATLPLIAAVNQSSIPMAAEVDEFDAVGLAKAPSRFVRPPRVAATPAALECKVMKILTLGDAPAESVVTITFGKVVGMTLKREFLDKNGYFDTRAAQPVGRLGGVKYAVSEEPFELERKFSQAFQHLY